MTNKLCYVSVALLRSYFIDYCYEVSNNTSTTADTANNNSNTTSATTKASNNNKNNHRVNEDIFLSDSSIAQDHVDYRIMNEIDTSDSNDNNYNDNGYGYGTDSPSLSSHLPVPPLSPTSPPRPPSTDISHQSSQQIDSILLLVNDILLSMGETGGDVGAAGNVGAAGVVGVLRRVYYEAQVRGCLGQTDW